MTKEILILNSMSTSTKYSIHLQFKTEKELQEVIEVLKPLGYTFRRPMR